MPTLVLLRHGESDWNKKNLFTAGSMSTSALPARRRRNGPANCSPRTVVARCRAHVAAAAGDPFGRDRAARGRSARDPGASLVAAERAPLRRAAGQGQGGVRAEFGDDQFMLCAVRTTPRRRRWPTTMSTAKLLTRVMRPARVGAAHGVPRRCVSRLLPYWYDAIDARPAPSPPS